MEKYRCRCHIQTARKANKPTTNEDMAQALTTGDYIQRRLRPMRGRLRLGDTLLLASQTLWVGLAGFALIQLAGRLVPIPNLLLWSLLPPALWLLAILGYLLVRP